VVDDSPSVRALLAGRLREHGHEIEEAPDGETAAAKALATPPDAVVTDLHMEGISGVQLCRILRAEPATAHVPVVLLTASGDKRSRFWARSAGAAAYVGKDCMDELVSLLPDLVASSRAQRPSVWPDPRGSARRTLPERMSAILDLALFESVVAGEVRALATSGEHTRLFEGLVALLADVLTYRWLALVPARPYPPVFAHANVGERDRIEAAVRAALRAGPERSFHLVADDRSVAGDGAPPETWPVVFAGQSIGTLALASTGRGLSREDRRTLSLVAGELAGPLQMCALYEDARRLATMDALTGLLNRRAFLDAIERERARSDRHVLPFSLLLLDLDHFKAVNDTHGHAAGDAVLKGCAEVLARVARRSDVVARWGGEEFVVALPHTGEAGARVAGERVRRGIAEATYLVPSGEPFRVTASIGVASSESPWTLEAIVAAADAAMYSAKSRGRNRVESMLANEMPAAHGLARAFSRVQGAPPK
jgi:two-component system cell cycle response regulator